MAPVTPRIPMSPAAPNAGTYGAMAERLQQDNINLSIERSVQEHLAVFQTGVNRVRKNMPEILSNMPVDASGKPTVSAAEANAMLADMEQEYRRSTQRLKGEVRALYVNGPNGAPPDRRWLQEVTNKLNEKHTVEFNQKFIDKYGAKGQVMLQALHDETEYVQQGPLGRAVSKIGTPGGIIGAIAAGALAFLGMGGMEGGVLAIVGGLVGVMAGGVLGGTINNWIADSRKPRQPEAPATPVPEPEQAKGKEREKEPVKTTPGAELMTGNLIPGDTPSTQPISPTQGFKK